MRRAHTAVRRCLVLPAMVAAYFVVTGCSGGSSANQYSLVAGGNAEHGRQVIVEKGCGACHVIPGIYTARGLVGPPLSFYGRRTMIAGELPNTPENLIRWVQHPTEVEPGTAMPDLGLTNQEARDVAAYLYTLR
jgi:cytochrome c1